MRPVKVGPVDRDLRLWYRLRGLEDGRVGGRVGHGESKDTSKVGGWEFGQRYVRREGQPKFLPGASCAHLRRRRRAKYRTKFTSKRGIRRQLEDGRDRRACCPSTRSFYGRTLLRPTGTRMPSSPPLPDRRQVGSSDTPPEQRQIKEADSSYRFF